MTFVNKLSKYIFFEKKKQKHFVSSIKVSNFAPAIRKDIAYNGSLAQLNRASDYGSEGCRFESCTNHRDEDKEEMIFLICPFSV